MDVDRYPEDVFEEHIPVLVNRAITVEALTLALALTLRVRHLQTTDRCRFLGCLLFNADDTLASYDYHSLGHGVHFLDRFCLNYIQIDLVQNFKSKSLLLAVWLQLHSEGNEAGWPYFFKLPCFIFVKEDIQESG